MPDLSASTTSLAPLAPITQPYLLCLNVTCYRDASGRRYFDRLWQRDLAEHVRYLENLTLASPCKIGTPPPDAVACDPSLQQIRFVDLPFTDSIKRAILCLPAIVSRLWKEIGRSSIVHVGVAGWPIPFGWVAGPIAVLRGKPYLVIVESAPWRLHPGMRATLRAKLLALFSEWCSRWCVNHARLVIATQDEYRTSLLTRNPAEGYVIPASWLNDADLISDEDAADSWHFKRLSGRRQLKVLFAGRLIPSKGIRLLIDAMRLLQAESAAIELDILGEGELFDECREISRGLDGATKVNLIGTVPYGERFFHLLRAYHAVVVPSLSDEQPRIVYDAFSQAVPVLASKTAGLRQCVEEGQTGVFATAHNSSSWADILRWSLQHTDELERMAIAALRTARGMTHTKMHEQRWRLLQTMPSGREPV